MKEMLELLGLEVPKRERRSITKDGDDISWDFAGYMLDIINFSGVKVKSKNAIPSHPRWIGDKGFMSYKEVCYWYSVIKKQRVMDGYYDRYL